MWMPRLKYIFFFNEKGGGAKTPLEFNKRELPLLVLDLYPCGCTTPLVTRNALYLCSAKKKAIILVASSYGNNCLNLAKYLDKPLGIAESLRALVGKGKEVKKELSSSQLVKNVDVGTGERGKDRRKNYWKSWPSIMEQFPRGFWRGFMFILRLHPLLSA